MKGLCVDGPNVGAVVQMSDLPNKSNVFKILDPNQPALVKASDDFNDVWAPLIVNTYYRYPTNLFAQAYGFDALYRFNSSNRR